MSSELIAQIRAALEGTTPGPWEVKDLGIRNDGDIRVCQVIDDFIGSHCICCLALMGDTIDQKGEEWTPETLTQWLTDAKLIAAAPTLLTQAADALEDLTLKLKVAEEALRFYSAVEWS